MLAPCEVDFSNSLNVDFSDSPNLAFLAFSALTLSRSALPFNLIPERTRTLLTVLSSRLFAFEPLGGAMLNSWVVELEV